MLALLFDYLKTLWTLFSLAPPCAGAAAACMLGGWCDGGASPTPTPGSWRWGLVTGGSLGMAGAECCEGAVT